VNANHRLLSPFLLRRAPGRYLRGRSREPPARGSARIDPTVRREALPPPFRWTARDSRVRGIGRTGSRSSEVDARQLGRPPRRPTYRSTAIAVGLLLAGQQAQLERVREADRRQVTRGSESAGQVPPVERAAELRVSGPGGLHERMAQRLSGRGEARPSGRGTLEGTPPLPVRLKHEYGRPARAVLVAQVRSEGVRLRVPLRNPGAWLGGIATNRRGKPLAD
jgi:hypothetical protein